MQNKVQQIQQIIQRKYDKKCKQLSLHEKNEYWTDVLLGRDWSFLKQLQLHKCEVTDDTISFVFNVKWPDLAELYLRENYLTSKGIKLMLNCCLLNLKKLMLSSNPIGNSGVKYLIKVDLPMLKILSISGCPIESEGLKHLTKARWPNLSSLQLGCFSQLLNSWEMVGQNHFQKLQELFVDETQPIWWISWVCWGLLHKTNVQINQFFIPIKNKMLKQSILQMRKSKRPFNSL